ncbi:hypothetical protein HUJ04_012162 [Dendroctonus ponderosae]|nr:hypothetical protein HUJ04_012162 [Dendroctonus ponderosae]
MKKIKGKLTRIFQYSEALLAVLFCCILSAESKIWLHPDTGLNLYQFLDKHGYGFYENHTVVTEDDYVLSLLRIPRGKNESGRTNAPKPVALLVHGILSTPKDLLVKGDDSIGFSLAEAGFDVFLMSCRGNRYSLAHRKFSIDSLPYWNFSWHEVAYYDIPANMDYIAKLTGQSNVSFLGHSQGGTAFVVLAATRPEYRARITSAQLFAPVVYMDRCRIPFFRMAVEIQEQIEDIFRDLQLNKVVLPYNPALLPLVIRLCHRDSPYLNLCVSLTGILGPDPEQIDVSKITVLATEYPAGGSFKAVMHYLQVAKTGRKPKGVSKKKRFAGIFRQYNYRTRNAKMYNQPNPPMYNLSAINDVPVYVWYGMNDYFCGPSDFKRLISEIPSAIGKQVAYPRWNHIDFIYARNASDIVYKETIRIMKKYTKIHP